MSLGDFSKLLAHFCVSGGSYSTSDSVGPPDSVSLLIYKAPPKMVSNFRKLPDPGPKLLTLNPEP